jgi:hypothetical protein
LPYGCVDFVCLDTLFSCRIAPLLYSADIYLVPKFSFL